MSKAVEARAHRGVLVVFAVTVAISAALALAGCGGEGSTAQAGTGAPAAVAPTAAAAVPASPASPTTQGSLGQDVYFRACARCHGDDMQGKDTTPKLDRVRVASIGDQALEITIQTGKGKMPAFGALNMQQIDAVIAYLRLVAV